MRTRSALTVAVTVVAVTATGPTASAQTPTEDSVSGRATDCADLIGSLCFRPTFVEVDARSGPSGENPTGTAEWETQIGSTVLGVAGPVTCLAVSGNTAIFGFRGAPNERTVVRVTDGGPAAGQDSFAVVTQASLSGTTLPPPDCSAFPPSLAGEVEVARSGVNEFGDIVVVDAQPLPTTEEQCKNSGWRNFGVFKNQGDCVSFVATGGKIPPANSP